MTRVISKDGTAIAFDRSGRGRPLILVDGALCRRSFGPMPNLAPLLAPHFTVYTYDRRGRNESGDTPPYAVAREVEDLAALIDDAGGSAFVYGVSSGAALALEAVMGGGKSPAALRHAVEAVGEVVPGAHRRILEGQTHNVKAEALAPALVEYFAG